MRGILSGRIDPLRCQRGRGSKPRTPQSPSIDRQGYNEGRMSEGALHIGTSGWHYGHWKGIFYPKDISSRDFLRFYQTRFRTVEINSSFYHLPLEKTLSQWKDTAPGGFIFSAKASRFITHMKKLRDPEESLPPLFGRLEILGEKLGPILFQLPPFLKLDPDRLRDFLKALPRGHRYSFEFRNSDWFREEIYGILAEYGAAFCIYDLNGKLSPRPVTAAFVYVRLHGPDDPYQGQYGARRLSRWARDFAYWSTEGKTIYCYFDNDQAGYAAQDALKLQEMVRKKMGGRSSGDPGG